jgi:hypothetical protein
MKIIDKKPYTAHQELSELLPWYVNKTLQGAELRAVETHLAVCLTCKRELMQLQRLAQAVIKEGALDSAEQASFLRLKKRLHSGKQLDVHSLPQQVHLGQKPVGVFNSVSQINTANKRGWTSSAMPRTALAMAAVLLLSLSVLMPRYVGNADLLGSNFRTLSDAPDAKQDGISANEIRVVFADNVDQQQKNTILERVHGRFVSDNPTAQGVYTVRLEKDMAVKHLLDVIELLRKDNNIVFAEPAYALLSSAHAER